MKKLGTAIVLGVALTAGTAMTATAQAMPLSQLGPSANSLMPLEKTQLFIFGGRHYCFYLDGWHGPGWYWCGYAWRRGFGWGGPRGWHGWHPGRPGPHPGPGPRFHPGGPGMHGRRGPGGRGPHHH